MGCTARYTYLRPSGPLRRDHELVPPPLAHSFCHTFSGTPIHCHSLWCWRGRGRRQESISDLSRFGSIELSTSCADKNLLISPSHQQRCASIQICRGLKTPIEIQLPTGARPRKRRRVSCATPTIDGRLLEAGREPESELKRPTPTPRRACGRRRARAP